MNPINNLTWQGVIPAQSEGTMVWYDVWANNSYGKVTLIDNSGAYFYFGVFSGQELILGLPLVRWQVLALIWGILDVAILVLFRKEDFAPKLSRRSKTVLYVAVISLMLSMLYLLMLFF
jgi:hypothetical protein